MKYYIMNWLKINFVRSKLWELFGENLNLIYSYFTHSNYICTSEEFVAQLWTLTLSHKNEFFSTFRYLLQVFYVF